MTNVEDIIAGYFDETKETAACKADAERLYQEAIRITMELNSSYHPRTKSGRSWAA